VVLCQSSREWRKYWDRMGFYSVLVVFRVDMVLIVVMYTMLYQNLMVNLKQLTTNVICAGGVLIHCMVYLCILTIQKMRNTWSNPFALQQNEYSGLPVFSFLAENIPIATNIPSHFQQGNFLFVSIPHVSMLL